MLIRAGYDISFTCQQRLPMLATLSVHASRNKDLRTAQRIFTQPDVPLYDYVDMVSFKDLKLYYPKADEKPRRELLSIRVGLEN
jgi:hypothetical protein